MFDTVMRIGQSVVQHGPYNNRIYLMKLMPDDADGIISHLERMCSEHRYTKVFAKVPASLRSVFDDAGYQEEAYVPGFFEGQEDAVFFGHYCDPQRARDPHAERVREVIEVAQAKASSKPACEDIPIFEATPEDAEEMAEVYRDVFDTYPFPIHEPSYLRETMATHVRYFGVREEGSIIALSSAEMDRASAAVEMTDFATLPACRGRGFATNLLATMESAVASQMRTGYTIARSLSFGMNITFSRMGYVFAGTLINNTNISGHIESMNVWYKPLSAAQRAIAG